MASSAKKQGNSVRQCGGILSRLVYCRAEHDGVDVSPLLAQAGLSRAAVEDPNARVDVTNQIKFVGLVADALGDKNLGFHLAFQHDVRQIGLLYYVAASADTLGNALRRAERYIGIQNEGVRIKVAKGKLVRIDVEYSGVARHTDVQQIEFIVASLIRICRQLTGRTLSPTRVRLVHRLGRDKPALERLLDCTIEDDSGVDRIEFPSASWDLPLISADPHLHKMCVQRCEEALADRDEDTSSLKVQVENAIAALLPHGQARHETVAAQLGMSPRTLARRLAAEGLSFAGIMEEVRSALAERYLADRALPISEIAWLLGYAEISTFTRAYQRWTGMLPSVARVQQQRRAS